MQAWAGIAIAQGALLVVSLRRLWRVAAEPGPAAEPAEAEAAGPGAPAPRTIWWPGLASFVTAALAAIVLVGDTGRWSVLAIFGTLVLATDVLLLRSVLVASLCTRPREA